MLVDIILYLLSIIQYLYQQTKSLVNSLHLQIYPIEAVSL